jgi:MYXO-CTERM domain-containing protein
MGADAGANNGRCIETDCIGKNCAAGQVCQAGACVDACTGAVCPMNQTCKVGQCVNVPMMDAGSDSGIIVPPMDEAGTGDDASTGGDDAGDNGDLFGSDKPASGCGCRTASGGDERGLFIAAGIGLAAMFVRRRRRTNKR